MSNTVSQTNNLKRLGGITYVTINGVAFDVVSDVSWSPNTVKRDTAIGLSGVQGWMEMPVAGIMKFTLRDNGSLTVADFNALTNATIQIQQNNGKQIIGTSMWLVEVQTVESQEATFELEFQGVNVQEVVVS